MVSGQNLITNPGFENSGAGWTLWTQTADSQAVASVTYPTTGAHAGTRYARVVVSTPAASAAENWHVQFQPPGWTAGVGATYEFKFWAKSDSSANIHVSVQDAAYTYITGTSFGLTTEWTEYSLTHVSDAEGANAVRFHIYLGESVNAYGFDDVSVTAQVTGIRGNGPAQGQGLQVRQGRDNLVLTLEGRVSGDVQAELIDLRGTILATASGGAESILLDLPGKTGTYVVLARTATRAWVRRISVP
jgi:hypothetical protein